MKTLYLHIGTAKTGTTAIQLFCENNRELLAEQEYYYPEAFYEPHTGVWRNGNFLVVAIKNEQKVRQIEEEERIFKEGMDKIQELFQKYDNIILSDETIWWASSYLKPELWQKLKKIAEEKGFAIKIVAYLRRQDSFAESHWNQQVKKDGIARTCEEHLEYLMKQRPLMLDYYQKLEDIAQYMGRENIIIRRFKPASFEGGSIYKDFAKTIGIEWREDFNSLEKRANERLKGNTHEIKRILNGMQGLSKEESIFYHRVLMRYSDEIVETEKYSMFSATEIKEILEKYEDGNRKIAEQYIKDGKPLFDNKIEELPKWEKNNQYMYEDMLRFTTMAMTQSLRENNALKADLKNLKEKIKHPVRTGYARWFKK